MADSSLSFSGDARAPPAHARTFEPSIKSQFWEILTTFGDKYPQNGSKNEPMAPRTNLECPHKGPSVDTGERHCQSINQSAVGRPVGRSVRQSFRQSFSLSFSQYTGTSLIRNCTPRGPYSRIMPRAPGGRAVSYKRGIPAGRPVSKSVG